MIPRKITDTLLSYSKFPVIAILGPRQSGKTTLVQKIFKDHKYISFENPNGIILDEFQYVPQILSHIQLDVDEKNVPVILFLLALKIFYSIKLLRNLLQDVLEYSPCYHYQFKN